MMSKHGLVVKCPDCGTDYIYSVRSNDIHKCENHREQVLNNLDNMPFGFGRKLLKKYFKVGK